MSGRVLWLAGGLGGALLLLCCLLALPGAAAQAPSFDTVIISEVAWGGTASGPLYEWLELYNYGEEPVDLLGWTLQDNGVLARLSGVIQPDGFYVLERYESVLIDIAADSRLLGILEDSGETILLLDQGDGLVDSANIDGGDWPAGTAAPDHLSMERVHPQSSDEPAGWASNDGITRNGLDTNGLPVNGTPGKPNSSWLFDLPADLSLEKSGPDSAIAGGPLTYVLSVSNTGQSAANDVVITDTLPSALHFVADDGHYPLTVSGTGTLTWQVGTLDPGLLITIRLTTSVALTFTGFLTNFAEVSLADPEEHGQDNHDSLATWVSSPDPVILIDAVYYDGYELQDADEAVRLMNVGGSTQSLAGWRLSDGLQEAIIPAGVRLDAGEGIWVSDDAVSFRRQFGHDPDFEVRGSDPNVPDMGGTWPGFANSGDEVLLMSPGGQIADVLVYEDGNVGQEGWSGPALEPYVVSGVFSAEGQILSRLTGPDSHSRMPDTDSAQDWLQSTHDPITARRVRYPGWDVDSFNQTDWFTETAEVIIGITPDNGFELLQEELAGAQSQLLIASHTFRSAPLNEELIRARQRGVSVTVLLEGDPVGGIDDAQQAVCQELELAGGQCWLMINDPDQDIYDRYRYLHAKFMIIDDSRAVISTENLSPDSYPDDDKSDGTWGRRGVLVVTDAPAVVDYLRLLWAQDFDPLNHRDLAPWPAMGASPERLTVPASELSATSEFTYSVRYTEAIRLQGQMPMAVVRAPEDALGSHNGLLHLLNQAGAGDTVLVQQLSERPHWGPTGSNPDQDPNPRLEALLNAARRGARVQLLLDLLYDDAGSPVSNEATCRYVNDTARVERLDIRCERANPSGLGLHNKMFLAEIGHRGYVFVGSINGTELSSKGNREVALLLQSDAVYQILADMFSRDWPRHIALPLIFNDYIGPARHILISEISYDPPGIDDAEFVELFNPTHLPLDISGYSIGDAVERSDFEDVRRFPNGTSIGPGEVIVVATTSTGFVAHFGFKPDFEILDSDPFVPDLLDDPEWGHPAAFLQLANDGDEVIVRDRSDTVVEAVTYGVGNLAGNVACSLNTITGSVLERYPPWRDTDDCPSDFREWPFPNPGTIP